MTALLETLTTLKQELDQEIDRLLSRAIAEFTREDPLVADLFSYTKTYILSGGKRLRGALCIMAYEGCGGTERSKILTAAASIELLHAFLLAHDDIIDRDEKRHGVATLHAWYEKRSKELFSLPNAAHFGTSMGIIGGDFLYAVGNRALFESGFAHDRLFAALSALQAVVARTVVGETQDVVIEMSGTASQEATVLRMYENKTARYTIEGPLHIGALLAGGPQELHTQISQFAVPLGVAFQIQDDILGMFGDEKRTGKPVGSDVREGKITLLITTALSSAPNDHTIRRTLGRRDATDAEIDAVRRIIEETGTRKVVTDQAKALVAKSKEAIDHMEFSPTTRRFLSDLADYIVERAQ